MKSSSILLMCLLGTVANGQQMGRAVCDAELGDLYLPCTCDVYDYTDYGITCRGVESADLIQAAFSRVPVIDHYQLQISLTSFATLPENLISDKRVRLLDISCPDEDFLLGPVHSDAFRSSQDYTIRLSIFGCNLNAVAFTFLEDFTVLEKVYLTSSSLLVFQDLPLLSSLKTLSLQDVKGFSQWYQPQQTPNLEEVSVISTADEAIVTNILESLASYNETLRILQIRDAGLQEIPQRVRWLPQLKELRLGFNNVSYLPAGSLALTSRLNLLSLPWMQILSIDPGAFKGDFSSTQIDLYSNNLTVFAHDVFRPILETMVDDKGFINIYGRFENLMECDCSLSWLIRDCPYLLPKVVDGKCANETKFEVLDPAGFADCPVVCEPSQ